MSPHLMDVHPFYANPRKPWVKGGTKWRLTSAKLLSFLSTYKLTYLLALLTNSAKVSKVFKVFPSLLVVSVGSLMTFWKR